jgi:hypothetical protein
MRGPASLQWVEIAAYDQTAGFTLEFEAFERSEQPQNQKRGFAAALKRSRAIGGQRSKVNRSCSRQSVGGDASLNFGCRP